MKGIIFEIKETGVYVLDKEGFFSFVFGFQCSEIGDEIEFDFVPEPRHPP